MKQAMQSGERGGKARRVRRTGAGWGLVAAVLLAGVTGRAAAAKAAHAGLWVGTVTIEQINRPGPASAPWDTETLQPAANPFSFRVLLHVDAEGQTRLLQRVLAVWNPHGEVVTNALTAQVETNGFYVLLRDESQVTQYREANADTKVFRISTVNLPLMDPLPLNGQFGGTNQLSGTVTIPYDRPDNPFVHVFAPLHDNQRTRNGVTTKLPAGEESWTIIRDVNFRFAAEDPEQPGNPAWDARETGGEYRETLRGIYQPIRLRGKFRLERLSAIDHLEP
jgi:hypothetical protein